MSPLDIPSTIIIKKINENLEHDPGKRKQIWEYPVEIRNEIGRAHIKEDPY